jgi:hypothetical protein
MFRTGGGYLIDPGQRRDGLSGSYRMFGVRPDPYRDQNREYYAAVLRMFRCAHFHLKYLEFNICTRIHCAIVIRYLSVICFPVEDVGLIVGMDVTEVGNIFSFKGNDDIFKLLFLYF